MKVLVVEDDGASRLMLQRALVRAGHDVSVAVDGAAGLEAIKADDFDVVISDWLMPKMDGVDLCREVRFLDKGSYVYFVMLTAKDRKEDRLLALNAGADDVMSKPMDSAEMIARLEVASRLKRMQEEMRQKSIDLHQMKSTLEQTNRRVNDLFKGLPIPCVAIDISGSIMEWNRAAEELFGLRSFEVWLQPIWDVLVPRRYRRNVVKLAQAAIEGAEQKSVPLRYIDKNGQQKHLSFSTFPLRSAEGVLVGSAFACVDLTPQKSLEAEIKQQLKIQQKLNSDLEALSAQLQLLADTDGLTGLHNHRTFRARLAEEVERAAQTGEPLSLLLTDVDKFKSFNDEFGHLVGDEVLRRVSAVFKEIVARTDRCFVARYGGEEFVVIAPGFAAIKACSLAETLRVGVENEQWPWRQVTSSFGVSTWNASMPDLEAFIKEADDALYQSKQNGRNRVTHYETLRTQAA